MMWNNGAVAIANYLKRATCLTELRLHHSREVYANYATTKTLLELLKAAAMCKTLQKLTIPYTYEFKCKERKKIFNILSESQSLTYFDCRGPRSMPQKLLKKIQPILERNKELLVQPKSSYSTKSANSVHFT